MGLTPRHGSSAPAKISESSKDARLFCLEGPVVRAGARRFPRRGWLLRSVAPKFALLLVVLFFRRSMLMLSGGICSQHAFIRIDPSRDRSIVSSVFVGQHPLPKTVLVRSCVAHRSTSGPVVVPTSAGLYYCCFPIDIGHLSGADVCLGRD